MTTSTIHKLHPVQSNSNADKPQLVNWFMSKLMLGTAVYWDPAICSTIWIVGCICTEQNPTESYQTERHLKDTMQISNWPTFEEIKLLHNKLKLLWTEGHVKLFELGDIWNEIDHCFLHAFCMSPRPHSSEPQPAPQSSPCDCMQCCDQRIAQFSIVSTHCLTHRELNSQIRSLTKSYVHPQPQGCDKLNDESWTELRI